MILLGHLMLSAIWIVCAYCVWAPYRDTHIPHKYHHVKFLRGLNYYGWTRPHHRLRIIKQALDEMGDEFDKAWRSA